MNQREKIIVFGGLALAVLVVGWKLLRPGDASLADTTTINGAIARIESGGRLRAEVDTLARDLALAIPQLPPSEQESAIRDDLARKARECDLIAISLKGIESTQRGASRLVMQVQYRLELYGAYDGFMKLITLLEKSPVPYVVKEISFESSPRPPAGVGDQGGQGGPGGGGDQVLPNGMSLAQLPPEMREKAEKMMRGREGRGGGVPGAQANGKVHGTMRVQSFLFPAEATGTRAPATAAPAATGSFPAAEHKGAENPALHNLSKERQDERQARPGAGSDEQAPAGGEARATSQTQQAKEK